MVSGKKNISTFQEFKASASDLTKFQYIIRIVLSAIVVSRLDEEDRVHPHTTKYYLQQYGTYVWSLYERFVEKHLIRGP